MKKEELQQTAVEAFGARWTKKIRPNIVIYNLLESNNGATETADSNLLLEAATDVSGLYKGTNVLQHVFMCPEDLYVARFRKKAERFKFDPTPWISWSEGDIDLLDDIGRVFCVRQGANFESVGDQIRFYQHELGHPYASKLAPVYSDLLADNEGLVEADSRIALATQSRADMKFSTDFIVGQDISQLPTAEEINQTGYDHPSFIEKTVSLNPGYAATFLWFFGQALKIAESQGHNHGLGEMYLTGRKLLLAVAAEANSVEDYILKLQSRFGFDYITLSKSNDFLLQSQERFRAAYLG